MSGGREDFVEVVSKGIVLPFGNAATLTMITKRNEDPNAGPVGTLFSYGVVFIDDPVTSYRLADVTQPTTTPPLLAQWPFVSIVAQTTRFVTKTVKLNAGSGAWGCDLAGNVIMVPVIGYDQRGRAIRFSVPLYFFQLPGAPSAALQAYQGALAGSPYALTAPNGSGASLNVPMNGQRVAYAYSRRDDTTFATQSLSLYVTPVAEPFVYAPFVTSATVDIDALNQYLPPGPTGGAPSVQVTYHPRYVEAASLPASAGNPPLAASTSCGNGLDSGNNKSQLLFKLQSPSSVSADFTNRPDGGTAFVAPNTTFSALSRTTGPAYDGPSSSSAPLVVRSAAQSGPPWGGNPVTLPVDTFTDGLFDPSYFLGQSQGALNSLRIFGVFSLTDIIQKVLPADAVADLQGLVKTGVAAAEQSALKYAPRYIAEGLSEIEQILSTIQEVKSQIELVYTNAQELLTTLATANAVGPVLGAASAALDAGVQATTALVGHTIADVQAQANLVVGAAQNFYATLMATVAFIENMDVASLTGADSPRDGSLEQLATNGVNLQKAIATFAAWGFRATINAKSVATNAAQLAAAAAQAATGARVVALTGSAPSAAQVTNAALQIAQGIQNTFGNKLAQLNGILGAVAGDAAALQTLFNNAAQAVDAVRDMTVKIEWQPKIGSFSAGGFTIFRPATQHALTLTLEARAKGTPTQAAGADVSCRLDHFDICLGSDPVVALQFDHISFDMKVGSKPDVDVQINGIAFGGPLAFLETLKNLIPLDGFSDPPYLNIDVNGISAGFTLAVPSVAVGMFTLENVSISAGLTIPLFTTSSAGKALTFTFSFCDKDHPFLVTVSMLGGCGYFTVSLTPAGLQHLEASIGVAAQIAINLLDVAQGSVTIMATITFTLDSGDVSLTATLRLHGELDVLSLITVSVDLSVSMTYDAGQNMIVAQAEIKVEVSVAFFSKSVDIPFRKEFHACNNDPTLRELMPPDPATGLPSQYWQEYCTAYAYV